MSKKIVVKKFHEALLGDRTERKIGEFVLSRDILNNGIKVLPEKIYRELKEKKISGKDMQKFFDEKRPEIKITSYAPITDEDLEFLE